MKIRLRLRLMLLLMLGVSIHIDAPCASVVASQGQSHDYRLIASYGHGNLQDLAWNPATNTLAITSASGLWLYHNEELNKAADLSGAVAWDTAHNQVAIASPLNMVIYDVDTQEQITIPGAVSRFAWSPDGNKIAAILANARSYVIWDRASDTRTVYTLDGYDQLLDIVWNDTSDRIALLDLLGGVLVVDPTTNVITQHFARPDLLEYHALDWHNTTIALSSYGDVLIVNSESGNVVQEFTAGSIQKINTVQWSPSGTRIGLIDSYQVLSVWSFSEQTIGELFSTPHELINPTGYHEIEWVDDTHLYIKANAFSETNLPAIQLWDTTLGAQVDAIDMFYPRIRFLEWVTTPTEGLLVGYQDGNTRLWDFSSNLVVVSLPLDALNFDISPDENHMAFDGVVGEIYVFPWNPSELDNTLSPIANPITLAADTAFQLERPNPLGPTGIQYSPDGSLLAVSIQTIFTQLYPTDTYTPAADLTFATNLGVTAGPAWHPAGNMVADVNGDGRILFWNPESGTLIETISAQQDVDFLALGWNSVGDRFAAAGTGAGGELFIWDSDLTQPPYHAVAQATSSIAFLEWNSAQPDLVATASRDSIIHVWRVDSTTITLVDTFEHGANVTAIAWRLDGMVLATAGTDGIVRLWSDAEVPAAQPNLQVDQRNPHQND